MILNIVYRVLTPSENSVLSDDSAWDEAYSPGPQSGVTVLDTISEVDQRRDSISSIVYDTGVTRLQDGSGELSTVCNQAHMLQAYIARLERQKSHLEGVRDTLASEREDQDRGIDSLARQLQESEKREQAAKTRIRELMRVVVLEDP
ncbi:hypothetical protein KIPB_012466 [Kipferlia bialata]|uniref:Uncharacterized protein n=1 Tax=Kipferlia bialata TaxID=797122 RepID=A0A9K3D6P3_9EUKA|nr:hypothetical protein KIPB_012466 [Kipferlia bialata]|eukprot:g12466.t1